MHEHTPEIDRLNGIEGATFSPRDGLINPNLLKNHYRDRARSTGAQFRDGVYIYAIDNRGDRVRLDTWHADEPMTDAALMRMMTQDGPGEAEVGHLEKLEAGAIVIAGGAWSRNVLRLLGLKDYSEPIRRQICLVDNRETNLDAYGMIVDTSGLYFHNEGPHILAGYSPPEAPGYHFNYDGEEFFQKEIWPRMYARMSCCERLRHVTGWAGLYEVSADRSAIVGLAAPSVYEAHSFSGRGVMQSMARVRRSRNSSQKEGIPRVSMPLRLRAIASRPAASSSRNSTSDLNQSRSTAAQSSIDTSDAEVSCSSPSMFFTSRALEGNPVAVFTDARGLSDVEMQDIARETRLSETTFIIPRDDAARARSAGIKVRGFLLLPRNFGLRGASHPRHCFRHREGAQPK